MHHLRKAFVKGCCPAVGLDASWGLLAISHADSAVEQMGQRAHKSSRCSDAGEMHSLKSAAGEEMGFHAVNLALTARARPTEKQQMCDDSHRNSLKSLCTSNAAVIGQLAMVRAAQLQHQDIACRSCHVRVSNRN